MSSLPVLPHALIGAQVIAEALLDPFIGWNLGVGWAAKMANNEVEPVTDKLGYYCAPEMVLNEEKPEMLADWCACCLCAPDQLLS